MRANTLLGAVAASYLVLVVVVGCSPRRSHRSTRPSKICSHALSGPTGEHWLGTDTLGRDLLSQLLFGIRPSLVGAVQALGRISRSRSLGGHHSGYVGGWFDTIVGRTVDLAMSIPAIIMVLVVLGVFPNNPPAAMIALGVLASPGLIRIVRGATLGGARRTVRHCGTGVGCETFADHAHAHPSSGSWADPGASLAVRRDGPGLAGCAVVSGPAVRRQDGSPGAA